jgi:hypothetical protein
MLKAILCLMVGQCLADTWGFQQEHLTGRNQFSKEDGLIRIINIGLMGWRVVESWSVMIGLMWIL